VICGTQRRHQRDYVASYAQVANGAIGEIRSAKAYWNQAHVWYNERQPGQTDMEHMLRNWNNFAWLSGDHIVEQHVHNIDVINWFTQRTRIICFGVWKSSTAEKLVINTIILVWTLIMAMVLACTVRVVKLMIAPLVLVRF
jgi:predicted dehydrogenase